MKRYILLMSVILLPLSSKAQINMKHLMPRGCDYVEESAWYGKEKVNKIITTFPTGTLDPGIKKKRSNEKAISKSDLEKEIFYVDPVFNTCYITKVKDTPFGLWAKEELTRLRRNKSGYRDISIQPVETNHSYDSSYWRTLPLTAKANLFDLRATEGYINLKSEIEKRNGKPSKQLDELKKTMMKYYGVEL